MSRAWWLALVTGAAFAAPRADRIAPLEEMSSPAIQERSNAPTRCQHKESEISQLATNLVRSQRAEGRDFPNTITTQTDGTVSLGSSGDFSRDYAWEGFLRPTPGYQRVVPWLALGMETRKDSLVYICLDMRRPWRNSRLVMYHLNADGLDRGGLVSARNASAKLSPASLQVRPLNELVNWSENLPIASQLRDFFRGASGLVEGGFYRIANVAVRPGVEKIVILPAPMELIYETRTTVFGQHVGGRTARAYRTPANASWMESDDEANDQPHAPGGGEAPPEAPGIEFGF